MPQLLPGSTSITKITNLLRWLGSSIVVYFSVVITADILFAAAALIGIPFTRDAGAQIPRANQFVSKSATDKKPSTLGTDIGDPYPVQQSTDQEHSRLDPREVDALIKQGQQFVAARDFASARLVFQRAAEAGSAAAALALGASYDPLVLARLGLRDVDADVSKARAWYQKARELRAPEERKPRLLWDSSIIPSCSPAWACAALTPA
jgi:hypothetical protein